MKTTLFNFRKTGFALLLLAAIFVVPSCKKNTDPTILTGDTNIPLTQKDSVTSIFFKVNGSNLPGASIKVISNDNGMVTYGATIDLTAYPDSLVSNLITLIPQLINYYNPQGVVWSVTGNNTLNIQFKIKVTSEGMQNYFVEGKPWTIRYADGVGTNNSVTRSNGQTLTTTVTEKTGVDDWPYSLWLIKTSKVEFTAPADDPSISKVTFRINHKFGLVYVKVEGKNGKVLELDLINFFLL